MAAPGITQLGIVWSENSNLASFTTATTPDEISLEAKYLFCNNIKGTGGPSTPNYESGSGGSFNGNSNSDGTYPQLQFGTPNNIFQQLQTAGFTWKTYEEGCLYTAAPKSAPRHAPATFYTFTQPHQATAVTPSGTNNIRSDFTGTAGLTADIANGKLPDFFWISPTDINTGHDLVSGASGNENHPGQFDQWLQGKQAVPYTNCFPGLTALLAGMRENSVLIIGDDAHNGSTPVVTYYCILCKPAPSPAPSTHTGAHTHLDILYSIQNYFGLPKFENVSGFPALDTRYTALTTANLVPFPTPGGSVTPPNTGPPVIPPTGTANLGVTTTGTPDPPVFTQFQTDQTAAGRTITIGGQFHALPTKGAEMSLSVQSQFITNGSIPMIHINCDALSVDNGGPGIPLDSTWASTITQLWTDILNLGVDVMVRYHYEFQMLTAPTSGHNISGLSNSLAVQQSNYIAFHRAGYASYVAARAALGATNKIWFVWAPNGSGYDATPHSNAWPGDWYPGDDVVDIIGGDFYNSGTTNATFKQPLAMPGLANGILWAKTNTRGSSAASTPGVTNGTKPFMLSESGTVENTQDSTPGTSKALWMDNITALFEANPQIIAWMYNDSLGVTLDNHLATTSLSLDHWVTAANDVPFGSGVPTPPQPSGGIPKTTPDTTVPQFNGGDVYKATLIATSVYVGGAFSSATASGGGSVTRNNIAAYDTTSGALDVWNPNADGDVYDIIQGPSSKVFVCGGFANINGVARNKIALISRNTASASPTVDTTFIPGAINAEVYGMAYDPTGLSGAGALYIAGDFTSVGGNSVTYFACLNATTGAVQNWSPNVTNVNSAYHPGRRVCLGVHATDQTQIYIVGAFGTVNGSARLGIACVDKNPTASTPTLDAWAPDVQGNIGGSDSGTQGHDVAIRPDGTKIIVGFSGGGSGQDGNHGVCWTLVESGTLNRQNTRDWQSAVTGDSGDHNSCAADATYAAFGHHGNGGSPNPAGLGNPKCYLVEWAPLPGSNPVRPTPSGWIQSSLSGAQGVYTIELDSDRMLVGGDLTAPRTGLVQFDRTAVVVTPHISYQYNLDGGGWTTTGDEGADLDITLGQLGGGAHYIEVRAVDSVLGAGPASYYAWTIESSTIDPPTLVSSVDGQGQAVTEGGTTQSTTLVLTFTTDVSTQVYVSTNGGITFTGPYTSPATFTNLPLGLQNIQLQAREAGQTPSPITELDYTILPPTGGGGTGSGLYTKQIVVPGVAGQTQDVTIYVQATDTNVPPVQITQERQVVVEIPLGTTPPSVSILSPQDGSTVFSDDGSLSVLVQAINLNDTINTVQLTLDGSVFFDCVEQDDPSQWLGEITIPLGVASTITAVATDLDDELQGSDSITVIQSTAPQVLPAAILAPTAASNKPVQVNLYFTDHNGNNIGVVSPQDLQYVEQLNNPSTITFGVNLQDAISTFSKLDPDMHDWRLERAGEPIGAGILAQNGIQIDTDSRTMTISGVGWLGYFAYQYMLYDPLSEITGQNLSFINADIFNVARSLVDSVIGGPNSIPITFDHSLSGIQVMQQFLASDLQDLLTMITDLGGQVQGFDFEVTPQCQFKMYAPQKGGHSQLYLTQGRNIQRIQYTNPGLKANRVNGVGSGISSSQTVSLAQNQASQLRSRLYTDMAQFTNLTSYNQIKGLTESQLALDVQDQVSMTITSRPAYGENQWDMCSCGDWVHVEFDLEYVAVNDWYRLTQRTFQPDNDGNEIIEYQFSPNTINTGE